MPIQSILCCLSLLLAVFFVQAQSETPVIVMAAQGKMSYQAAGYSSKKIEAGAVFKNTGSIKMKAGSTATLFSEGQFQTLQGPKTSTLQAAFPDQGGTMKLNFERNFNDYALAALDLAANAQNPKDAWGTVTGKKGSGDGWGTVTGKKGSGDGWGTVTGKKGSGDGWGTVTGKKGSGDGWGGKGKEINTIAPFGKIRPGAKTFQWSKPAGASNYQLEIKSIKGATILKVTATDTTVSVNLDPAQFKEGQQYVWQVSGGDVLSNPMVFEIGSSQSLSAALQAAEKAESYAKNTATVQGLMRAVALEQGEWHAEAAQLYRDLQKAEPNNLLIKLMHAAFWMRNGPKPMAELAFKQ